MTWGPAAAKGIGIFSIVAKGSAAKNLWWESSLSKGTAYVIDLLYFLNYSFGSACFLFAFYSSAP